MASSSVDAVAKKTTKTALDRVSYWNETYKTIDPTTKGKIGVLLAFLIPYVLYNYVVPEPSSSCDISGRLELIFALQLLPACVMLFYVTYTGLLRVPSSPVAAHDPAAAYATNQMPLAVIAGNRAFVNTLEQYALLLAASAALVTVLPCDQLRLLPAWYVTWTVCRVLYIKGYVSSQPDARMLGFPGTAMPSMAALGYAIYLRVQQGVWY